MSHIVITGANGFVGRALVKRLLAQTRHTLTLIDHSFDDTGADPRARRIAGSFGDPTVLDAALETPADVVFHLASVPGALAEREPALGYQVNLLATLTLAHRLAQQQEQQQRKARLVFASSVAVYGALDPGDVHENQEARPALSYGAHKLMAEIELADLSRRGQLDAVSLRLPGIVARPPSESGHGSAFMSLVMHKLAAGQHYVCPVGPKATAWWMSLPCCIDNLLHGATMSTAGAPPARVWQLPVLHLSLRDVLDALAWRYGPQRRELLTFAPDERLETLFGRLPPLHTPAALAAGFRHDKDADSLIAAAMQGSLG
ncbi:NAD-dependent epimerase/dehydratase family protein [Duganella sp. BuS-21]|uniref:NAD-dependent epimerase/dehydratase family protein n=1 Tax=Duganella sp. BuS-21 TaxID=2943848 RepID=UPI0035A63EDE